MDAVCCSDSGCSQRLVAAAVQWAFTLFIFLETWITPVEGWLIDRLGPRIFLTLGGLLVGIGWTGMGYAQSLTQLYVLYGTAGVGAAFIYSGSIATALKWFPDKRGTVSGFITAGFGAGQRCLFPSSPASLPIPTTRLRFSIPESDRAC